VKQRISFTSGGVKKGKGIFNDDQTYETDIIGFFCTKSSNMDIFGFETLLEIKILI